MGIFGLVSLRKSLGVLRGWQAGDDGGRLCWLRGPDAEHLLVRLKDVVVVVVVREGWWCGGVGGRRGVLALPQHANHSPQRVPACRG